jgi:lipid-binding SYLF domain-containing protein
MAKYVVQNPVVVFAGGTISANVAQATIALEADDIEVTNFAGNGFRERIGGLKTGTLSMELHQDFAIGAIDSTFFTNLGGTVAVAIRPLGTAAAGSASPSYEFSVLVTEYSPIDSAVGDLATFSVSFPITGAVTRGTGA